MTNWAEKIGAQRRWIEDGDLCADELGGLLGDALDEVERLRVVVDAARKMDTILGERPSADNGRWWQRLSAVRSDFFRALTALDSPAPQSVEPKRAKLGKRFKELVARIPEDCPPVWAGEPRQPCGHPVSAIVSSDEGTHYCGECAEADAALEGRRCGTCADYIPMYADSDCPGRTGPDWCPNWRPWQPRKPRDKGGE